MVHARASVCVCVCVCVYTQFLSGTRTLYGAGAQPSAGRTPGAQNGALATSHRPKDWVHGDDVGELLCGHPLDEPERQVAAARREGVEHRIVGVDDVVVVKGIASTSSMRHWSDATSFRFQ